MITVEVLWSLFVAIWPTHGHCPHKAIICDNVLLTLNHGVAIHGTNWSGITMAAAWMSRAGSQRRECESNVYFDPRCKYYYQNYIYQHDT